MEPEKRKFEEVEGDTEEMLNQKRSADDSQPRTEEMITPRERVGAVIGNKGAVIQEIMKRSGTRIVINQKIEPNSAQITGRPDQISAAKELILKVMENGPSGLDEDSTYEVIVSTMDVPQDRVGAVIGAKGHVLNEIMKKTYSKISIDQNTPAGSPAVATITGRADKIEEAKRLIGLVVVDGPAAILTAMTVGEGGELLVESMDIAKEKVGPTIGAKGVIIQDIMRRSGCKINIEQETSPCKVIFTGTRGQIDSAVNLVQLVVMNGASSLQMLGTGSSSVAAINSIGVGVPNGSVINHEIPIVQAQVGKVIGTAGAVIKEFQMKCSVKAKVEIVNPNTDERLVRLTGEAAKVFKNQYFIIRSFKFY